MIDQSRLRRLSPASLLCSSFALAVLMLQGGHVATAKPQQGTFMASQTAASKPLFRDIGTFKNIGGYSGNVVGPGAEPGSQRLYASYVYIGDTIELVAIDPKTGEFQTFANPAKGETGTYGMILGPDNNVYTGTLDKAHILRLNTKTQKLEDLGRPSKTESYIWQFAVGPDKKLYGCTYPNCKLISYDPATGKMADLGRLDPTEQYARYIAAGDDGYLYIGIGTVKAGVVAYDIATKQHQQIIPDSDRSKEFYNTYRGVDGHVYAVHTDHVPGQQDKETIFRLENGQAVKLPTGAARPTAQPQNLLANGDSVKIQGHAIITMRGDKVVDSQRYHYEGRPLIAFRIGAGPDGKIYGSSMLPLYFFRMDPASGEFQTIGRVGGGETYSFLNYQGKVLLANYAGYGLLMSYDPEKPASPGAKPGSNPLYVTYDGADAAWRPQAMVAGLDGKVYIGAVSGYGKLGGPLAIWDTATNRVTALENIIPDQSVVSLAVDKTGMIYGGTTTRGGGGSHATQTDAKIFIFDPKTQKVEFETIPVPKASTITDLIFGSNGLLYGLADKTLFVFDPKTQQITHRSVNKFGWSVYNAAVTGPNGQIYGLATEGIFAINPATGDASLIAKSPKPITGGVALIGNELYFTSGATVCSYELPEASK